jgi:hypothetical protein
MKYGKFICIICSIVVFVGCKNKAVKKGGDLKTITISAEFVEQYCGGAEPSEELMDKISQLRPLANENIYISKFVNPVTFEEEQKLSLDKAGIGTLKLDTGLYVISFYKLTPPAPKVADDKPEPDRQQDQPEEPTPPSPPNEMDDKARKADCELRWKRMSATPFKVIGGKTAYKVALNKECNPCEEPRP